MRPVEMKAALRRLAGSLVSGLGWPGLLGLGALLLAGLLELGLARLWSEDRAALQAQAERLQRQLRAQRASEPVPQRLATPEQWRASLPEAAERQQRLADLLEAALRAGLNSPRTEHRLAVDAATGVERLRVSMPVQGGYAQLRGFLETALRQDPALSLDGLKLRRAAPAAAELEAELQWSLHGRAAPAPEQKP
jgi:Tfp pilus assembly protein PilO